MVGGKDLHLKFSQVGSEVDLTPFAAIPMIMLSIIVPENKVDIILELSLTLHS